MVTTAVTATKTDVPVRAYRRNGPGGHRLPGFRLFQRLCTATPGAAHRERGFALLIVLWALGFLALLGTQFGAEGRNAMALARNQRTAAMVGAATAGAIQHEIFALLASGGGDRIVGGITRRVRIGPVSVVLQVDNEGDRLNLNLAQGPQLTALLRQVGTAPQSAGSIAAAILDWRTDGTLPRPGGAKAPQYAAAGDRYAPPDAAFRSVGELGQVLGVTPKLLDRLRPHVTVFTKYEPLGISGDPVVARALLEAAPPGSRPRTGDLGALAVARITATGRGTDNSSVTLRAIVRLNGSLDGMPFTILSWRRLYDR